MVSENSTPSVLGVFCLRQIAAIGAGVTMVDHENVTYWYVRQVSADTVEVQPLTVGGLPSGIVKRIGIKELMASYVPEPLYYRDHAVPVLNSLASKVLDGDDDVSLGTLDERERAALEALQAAPLKLPDYSRPGYEAAHGVLMDELKRLLSMLTCQGQDARREHCARFNHFGVALRKDGLLDESIGFFAKALEVDQDDENIYFNMARVYFDKGDYAACGKALDTALRLNPQFGEANRFVRHLSRREDGVASSS